MVKINLYGKLRLRPTDETEEIESELKKLCRKYSINRIEAYLND